MDDVAVFERVHDPDFQFPSFDHLVGEFLTQFALFDGDVGAVSFVDIMQDLAETAGPQRHGSERPTTRVQRHFFLLVFCVFFFFFFALAFFQGDE